MTSYLGPAQLVLADRTCDVHVNLHEFIDLTEPAPARWRGVVVDASFEPTDQPDVCVRIPGIGEASAALFDRRLVGDGDAPFRTT